MIQSIALRIEDVVFELSFFEATAVGYYSSFKRPWVQKLTRLKSSIFNFERCMTRFILFCSFLLLFSCAKLQLYPPDCNFVACKVDCKKKAEVCNKVCRNNCRQCTAFADRLAQNSYCNYQHEQYVKGEIIALELNSFRDPLQCRKITCDCRADYQVCIQACGGVINKGLRVAPVC